MVGDGKGGGSVRPPAVGRVRVGSARETCGGFPLVYNIRENFQTLTYEGLKGRT